MMTPDRLSASADSAAGGADARAVPLARRLEESHVEPVPEGTAGSGGGDQLFATLREGWLLGVAVLLCTWVVAAGFMMVHGTTYTSTTNVFLKPVPGNALSAVSTTSSQQLTVAMQTESRLVLSPGVVALATKIAGAGLDPDIGGLSTSVPPNTQIVRIQFSARTPALARVGAASFATAFLRYRADQGARSEQRQLASLHAQSRSARRALNEATKQATAAHPQPGASTRVQLYTSRLAAISQSIGDLQAQDINAGSVVLPASSPATGMLGRPVWIFAFATLLGMVLGAGAVLARDRLDDRVRADREGAIGGVPIWTRMPWRPPDAPLVDALLVEGPLRESGRRARAGILRSTVRPCALMVMPDASRQRVVEPALVLALALRDAGHTVALVDASLGSESPPTGVLPAARTLAQYLLSPPPGRLEMPRWRGLRILPAGEALGAVRDLLVGRTMAELVAGLRETVDYVVVAAPEMASAEAAALGALCDISLLVARDGTTKHAQVHACAADHAAFGSDLAGAICVSRPTVWRRLRPRLRRWRRVVRLPRWVRRWWPHWLMSATGR